MAFNNFILKNQVNMSGLKTKIIGNGDLVGRPVSFLLKTKRSGC